MSGLVLPTLTTCIEQLVPRWLDSSFGRAVQDNRAVMGSSPIQVRVFSAEASSHQLLGFHFRSCILYILFEESLKLKDTLTNCGLNQIVFLPLFNQVNQYCPFTLHIVNHWVIGSGV